MLHSNSEKRHAMVLNAISTSISRLWAIIARQPPSDQPARLPGHPIRNAPRTQKMNCMGILFIGLQSLTKLRRYNIMNILYLHSKRLELWLGLRAS